MTSYLDPSASPETTETEANRLFNLAFEAVTRVEFKQKMVEARSLYEKASADFNKAAQSARSKRANSHRVYASFWLCTDSRERRKLVRECLKLSNEAVELLEGQSRNAELAETRFDLLNFAGEYLALATDSETRTLQFGQSLRVGRQAVEEFRRVDDDRLFHSLRKLIRLISLQGPVILDKNHLQAIRDETDELGRELFEVAQRIGTPFALCTTKAELGNIAFNIQGNLEKALEFYQEAASGASELDLLERGALFSGLASLSDWTGLSEGDRHRRLEMLERGIRYADMAVEILEIPYHTSLLASCHSSRAECHMTLANSVETQLEGKRSRLEEAVKSSSLGMTMEEGTVAWQLAAHALGKALYSLATISDSRTEKGRLLKQALSVREQVLQVTDILLPHFFWSRGVMRNYLALVQVELSDLGQTREERIELLERATSLLAECLELCGKSDSNPSFLVPLAQYSESYGDVLIRLFGLENSRENIRKAIIAYNNAIEYVSRAGNLASVPPIRWKLAKSFDLVGDFPRAAEAFTEAAAGYREAIKEIPSLSSAFNELATYMEAWAEIEGGREYHAEEEYGLSHESYESAAKRLRATKTWSGLAMLCDARSILEKGEAQSRAEKHEGAVESFRSALDRFRHAKGELQRVVGETTDIREREEIEDCLRIATQREAYAHGRILLEEARSLDRNGDKVRSSRKYHSASTSFEELARLVDATDDRAELESLARFCESWALMKEAEARASPELFAEAAESFMRTKENTARLSLRFLALGNASICRALESGTKFRQSRNFELYSDIKRHLEIASDHYTEGGFKQTGTWTRATQRLFDALMLLTSAEVERETRKKTDLYRMAEKHLVLAAKLYGEAGFPSRKVETLEHLERTREEKEVLLAPLEALAEVPTASATHLSSISLRGAQPLGLERFEEANIAGETRVPHRDLPIGSELTVSLDLVNVGKTVATLIKLENIVPEGFEPKAEDGQPQIQGNSYDLRGKMLDYLKTHEIKVTLRATRKGSFDLGPRAVFVDQKGNFRSYEFRPTVLTVRDQGISEGMQAPPTVTIPQDFHFENERSKEVFRHLVKVFLDDYMSRRIVMDKAGWRSLMDVIGDMKIPRSALYGPGGREGPVLAELGHRGLLEIRVSLKERGRGGRIRKIRVAYDNAIVRRIVEKAVMETI